MDQKTTVVRELRRAQWELERSREGVNIVLDHIEELLEELDPEGGEEE